MLITQDKFEKALKYLLEADTIALDTETYKTKFWDQRRMIGTSTYQLLSDGRSLSMYFPFRHCGTPGQDPNLPEEYIKDLGSALIDSGATLLFHNAKFDLNVYRLEQVELTNRFYDTMIISHMIDENSTHALKELGVHYKLEQYADKEQKIIALQEKAFRRWDLIPPELMEPYACKDVELTYRLWKKMMPWLKGQELDHLWENEEEWSRTLADAEFTGMPIDQGLGQEFAQQARQELAIIKEWLGFDPMKTSQLSAKLFTPVGEIATGKDPDTKGQWSVEGLGFKCLEYTDKGNYKLDAANLHKYNHPIMDLVLEYRSVLKALSTWYEGIPDACDSTGRIHTNFKQHGTKTTRLSSSDPNVQQLPRDIEKAPVKRLFLSDEACELWGYDASQIELRLAAIYANEESMLRTYKEGGDIHQLTADKVGISRNDGKTLNFTILYGGGRDRVSDVFGVSKSDASKILGSFWSAYPGLKAISSAVNRKATGTGYIKLWTGRRRHFQFTWETHKAFNSLIQGGAAEIIKQSALHYRRSLQVRESITKIVSFVHDDIWLMHPIKDREEEQKIAVYEFEWASRDSRFKIPFPFQPKRLA